MAPTVKPDEKAPAAEAPESEEPKEQTAKGDEDENKSVISSSSFHDDFDRKKYLV